MGRGLEMLFSSATARRPAVYYDMEYTPSMVVIGASAGGVDAIRSLARALPADFAAAVCIVLHIGSHKSELPWLLNQLGPLRASHPKDGDPIRPGEIQVAPCDSLNLGRCPAAFRTAGGPLHGIRTLPPPALHD